MTAFSEDVMDALCSLEPGDTVRLTTEREGEEMEITAYVADAYYEESERDPWGYAKGELMVSLEASSDEVERLELPTHSLDIYGTETRPGTWKHVSFSVWNPAVEDGEMVHDDSIDMGEITDVDREDSED